MPDHNQNSTASRRPRGGRGGFGPGGGIRPPGEKAKNFKATMKKLLAYLKPFRIQMIIAVVFAVVSTVCSVYGPKVIGNATTAIVEGVVKKYAGTGGIDFERINQILWTLLILYVTSMIFSALQGFFMSGIATRVSYNLREQLSQKINRMPLKYFDTKTHGEVLSRVTNDVDTIGQSLGQSMSQIVTSITSIIGTVIMMLTISPLMTLAAFLIIPVSLGVVMFVVSKSQKYFKRQQEFLGHINGQVEEVYGGHIIMKAFNAEDKALAEFNHFNDTLYQTAWKSQFMSGIMMPAMNFIGNLGYVAVAILGGFLTIRNVIAVGDILSFIQYIRRFMQPINEVAQISNVLQSTAAAAERVFEFLDEEEEVEDKAKTISTQGVQGNVAFEHVKFGYDPEKIIIHDFTSEIKPGQKIAIVGPTGAGKTTLVKLLMRFYELNGGQIKIDGVNILDFKRDDLRDLFGMVLQDTWLFNGTIMENIRYGNLEATDEQVKKAAKAAYADHFIRALPGSYDMVLNEEASNISQGQKQLLTIARAILSDPRILILDEATSSVDTRTEVLIQKAMDTLMKGRTSFIIAHRLSTIRDADAILVLNEGDIVEYGAHEELLAKCGFYAKLYNSQFEGGEEAS